MTAVYEALVRAMRARFGVPVEVVRSFLRDAGASRPREVTPEHARAVALAMAEEDERLNRSF